MPIKNQSMKRLERPIIFHQVGRQIIEQREMDRFGGASSKIAWRRDETLSEVPLPDAIGNHSRSQGILRTGNGFGQLQPTTSVSVGMARVDTCKRSAREHFQKTSFGLLTLSSPVTSDVHHRIAGFFPIDERHGPRRHGFNKLHNCVLRHLIERPQIVVLFDVV